MKSVIIGAGTYGEVYLAYLQEAGIEIVGFLDDDSKYINQKVCGIPVLGGFDFLACLKDEYGVKAVYCPLGNNKLRVELLNRALSLGYEVPNFIHSTVVLSPNVKIGDKGIYILPKTVIMPWCNIHDFVMMSVNSVVSHHTILEEGVFLSFGVNFGASIIAHKYAYIGISATVMTGVHELGENCLIGAGAVVIKDVPTNAVMAGIPAKVLKYRE
ncbi:acetyltransferase [Bacteroides cellulosilyticus]|uniref:acetyltransferase n=1 Tax=Bacteroides cellulosilyticus TaxID=246787 RepID=UPI001CCC5B36|nr:acetyltransferase [Bacteroides cellulosilyticus]UBD68638.1 acetyltransferase [Bacteroides cellulosilyticus]